MGSRPTATAEGLVQEGYIRGTAYTSPEIFRRELDVIFRRSWAFVAHESQVAQSGDYITTTLGTQPLIVTRTEEGDVKVLLNRCTHRGATVCQQREGNSQYFRCQYHGWTFKNDGGLSGVPFPKGYGSELDDVRDLALGQLESDSYRGFVFARVVPGPQTLFEHLGNAREYIDGFVDAAPNGRVVVHPHPTRYRYEGNWKFQMENGTDGYHPAFVHSGFLKAIARRTGVSKNPFQSDESAGKAVDLGNGHNVAILSAARHKHDRTEEYSDSYYDRALNAPEGGRLVAELEERLGADEAMRLLEPSNAYNLVVFPNLLLIQSQIRVVEPTAVDATNIVAYATEWPDAPAEVNRLRLRMQENFWGPAGMGVPDDLAMFERAQRGLQAETPVWLTVRRGLERDTAEGGTITGVGSDETTIRGFQREWGRRMAEEEA